MKKIKRKNIEELLIEIEILPGTVAFSNLVNMILLSLKTKEYSAAKLYAQLASQNSLSWNSAERSIRYPLQKFFSSDDVNPLLGKLFPAHTMYKKAPSVSCFVSTICWYLIEERKG